VGWPTCLHVAGSRIGLQFLATITKFVLVYWTISGKTSTATITISEQTKDSSMEEQQNNQQPDEMVTEDSMNIELDRYSKQLEDDCSQARLQEKKYQQKKKERPQLNQRPHRPDKKTTGTSAKQATTKTVTGPNGPCLQTLLLKRCRLKN